MGETVSDEADDRDPPDSGPFCQHFGDPADCHERCATCGHLCCQHDYYAPHECEADDCVCAAFEDEDEKP